ncbi:hypothetical protein [Synechococcus sp. CBW1107]|uniref:hypothetical protein n=1 Tax=Synechococcus sp. CBW1107 TaxID=2789857 RepID=UPI003A0FDD1B
MNLLVMSPVFIRLMRHSIKLSPYSHEPQELPVASWSLDSHIPGLADGMERI